MEERSNKTIMCSVLFLDIVEYSKKSVSGQISLKDRFNSYLSKAILDVPVTDRVILDTGDGAAINFIGDVEDALKAALSLRESLLNEDPDVDHPLLVRMGINLGPVRLVRDINGQPNIVGDGINVAQRVMGFADAAQILVSRSYYDAVSRLSPQYAGMFHYQGSRTDKHVREHEVYAIGYPGDKTTLRSMAKPVTTPRANGENFSTVAIGRVQAALRSIGSWTQNFIGNYRKAEPRQKVLYAGVVAVPLILLIMLMMNWEGHDAPPAIQGDLRLSGNAAPAVVPEAHKVNSSVGAAGVAEPKPSVESKTEAHPAVPSTKPKMVVQDKPVEKARDKSRPKDKPQLPENQPSPKVQQDVAGKPAAESPGGSKEAHISVDCTVGTEVFVDGVRKGSVGSKPFTIALPPGSHAVIVSHPSGGIHSQNVNLGSGKTVEIKPVFCR